MSDETMPEPSEGLTEQREGLTEARAREIVEDYRRDISIYNKDEYDFAKGYLERVAQEKALVEQEKVDKLVVGDCHSYCEAAAKHIETQEAALEAADRMAKILDREPTRTSEKVVAAYRTAREKTK